MADETPKDYTPKPMILQDIPSWPSEHFDAHLQTLAIGLRLPGLEDPKIKANVYWEVDDQGNNKPWLIFKLSSKEREEKEMIYLRDKIKYPVTPSFMRVAYLEWVVKEDGLKVDEAAVEKLKPLDTLPLKD